MEMSQVLNPGGSCPLFGSLQQGDCQSPKHISLLPQRLCYTGTTFLGAESGILNGGWVLTDLRRIFHGKKLDFSANIRDTYIVKTMTIISPLSLL